MTVAQTTTMYNDITVKLDGCDEMTKQQFLDQWITNELATMTAVFTRSCSKEKSTHGKKKTIGRIGQGRGIDQRRSSVVNDF